MGPYRFCGGDTLDKPSSAWAPSGFACSDGNPTTLWILLWSHLILSDTHMFEWLCNTVHPSKNYTQRVTQYKACTSQVKYILHITLVWCCFITTSYTQLVFVSISKAAAVLIDSRSSSLALDTAVALWSFTSRGTRGKIVKEFSHLQNLDCSRHSSLSRDVWRFKTRKIKNNIANKVILGCSDLTLSRICHHQCRCPYDIAKPMLVDYKLWIG